MNKTILAIGITILFICISFNSISGIQIDNKPIIKSDRGNILYVGGSGPNNYSKIQDAIDVTSDGDTVFVYDDSSPYYENLTIDKSISLIGENKDTTVIEYGVIVVKIIADWVTISGFTIQSGEYGIAIYQSNFSNINNNNIVNNGAGVDLMYSNNITINGNIIINNYLGLITAYSNYNTITDNNIICSDWVGIGLSHSNNSIISGNNISNSGRIYSGMNLHCCYNNTIFHNNLINNSKNAIDNGNNYWDNDYPSGGNYWDDYNGTDDDGDGIGDNSYTISSCDNKDRYPLMESYGMTNLTIYFLGGLFRFIGIIRNIGNKTAFNVQWKILFEGGFVLLGKNTQGILPKPLLPDNNYTSISSSIFFGIGKIIITIEVWADNAPKVTLSNPGFLLLFFIIM
ncbi:hypothetical protein AYK20_05705 [Thermoplasmatales archaeon SG8-52-1]|nr:MAG: hypothetical protein AYK20_05705 [Thermoplasmatales archaeon SG8-52-1]